MVLYIIMVITNLNKICLNCNEPFVAKRIDAIYCDERCSWTHYNKTKRGKNNTSIKPEEIPVISSVVEKESGLKKNIQILSSLEVDSRKGTEYSFEQLDSLGFNLDAYEFRVRLHNIDPIYNSHYTIIGNYKVFRTDFKTFLVYKMNS